jgi:hypothetical protein
MSEFQPEVTSGTPGSDPAASQPSANQPVVGYCRACGKALTAGTLRNAGGTIYCEEHAPSSPPPVPPGAPPRPLTQDAQPNPYAAPPPMPHSDASPGVAFVLGLIPGVGAIYNGQYAKGLVHVLILGLLFFAVGSDRAPEAIFIPMIFAFFFYMAFEAYHTARRRRAGLITEEFSGILPSQGSQFPVAAILLIALGTLFLLDNLNIFSLADVIEYWPVVLIALGVYMLIARASAGRERGGDGGQS